MGAMLRTVAVFLLVGPLSGCAINRPAIVDATKAQGGYYSSLSRAMAENKTTLQTALAEQLKADLVRERNLLAWERDLEKAEILLRQDANVTGNQLLLMMALGESQMASLARMQALQSVDESRSKAILELYDAVIKAAKALERNNKIILGYVGDGNANFAIRSLDVAAIAYAVTAAKQAGDAIDEANEEDAEQRKEDREKVEKNIEKARKILLGALGGD